MPRGQARRKGDVGGFRIPWAQALQFLAMALAAVSVYVGISVKLALLEERISMLREDNAEMKATVQSLGQNFAGIELYIQDLGRQVTGQRRAK